MLQYKIDGEIDSPLCACVEVTIEFSDGPRWLFFVTPQHLAGVGDFVDGSSTRIPLGELHMVVVSELSVAVIVAALWQIEKAGELVRRTVPLSPC